MRRIYEDSSQTVAVSPLLNFTGVSRSFLPPVDAWEYEIYDGGVAENAGLSCHVHNLDYMFVKNGELRPTSVSLFLPVPQHPRMNSTQLTKSTSSTNTFKTSLCMIDSNSSWMSVPSTHTLRDQ